MACRYILGHGRLMGVTEIVPAQQLISCAARCATWRKFMHFCDCTQGGLAGSQGWTVTTVCQSVAMILR